MRPRLRPWPRRPTPRRRRACSGRRAARNAPRPRRTSTAPSVRTRRCAARAQAAPWAAPRARKSACASCQAGRRCKSRSRWRRPQNRPSVGESSTASPPSSLPSRISKRLWSASGSGFSAGCRRGWRQLQWPSPAWQRAPTSVAVVLAAPDRAPPIRRAGAAADAPRRLRTPRPPSRRRLEPRPSTPPSNPAARRPITPTPRPRAIAACAVSIGREVPHAVEPIRAHPPW